MHFFNSMFLHKQNNIAIKYNSSIDFHVNVFRLTSLNAALLTAVMFTIVAFKAFKVNIKNLKLIKIKMSKEKVHYCSG